ncbi:MAG: DUF4129 domain-containing protein [Verrucomicrobiota bacterium]
MARPSTSGKSALELLEEAIHLLRLAPVRAWTFYMIGTLPFVLGFLFFWADMSRSAFASEHCGPAAFGLVLGFVWMKTWQTAFASELTAQIGGRNAPPWTVARAGRVAITQLIYQPSSFFVLPVAMLVVLPFGWAFAFYQNVLVLSGGTDSQWIFRKAAKQAGVFLAQNHLALLIIAGFALFVWFNLAALIFMLPGLIKMFLGVESVFTRSGVHSLFNTTFFAASFALTYLCVDPLVKSLYALRCFYGQAVTTGEDLKVDLKTHASLAKISAMLLPCAIFLATITFGEADDTQPQSARAVSPASVPAAELDRSIQKVLARPEFTWRLPREKVENPDAKKNWFVLFIDSVRETLVDGLRTLRDWIRDLLNWLEKFLRLNNSAGDKSGSGSGWMVTLQWMVFVLLALIASALVVLCLRMWKRRANKTALVAEAMPILPNLEDENVSANQLPEEGWLQLARELMEKGDLRLALRALYLAGLAHLAAREFLKIAKFKSNREYEGELRRRARALPDLQDAFGQNVTAFDRVWYGRHDATGEIVRGVQANLERIRAS